MPRNGSGAFSNVPGTTVSPNTTILSAWANAFSADVAATFNEAWPTSLGGTGGTSPATSRDALGLEIGVDIPSYGQMNIADRRQRIVNGDMMVSQENGTTAGTTNGYYAADQFATYRVTSAGVITSQRVASVTPAGSPYRYRVTITTADASLAAGEYLTITTNLEGSNVCDFQYGSAAAKAGVVRFGFKGPAGTYAARIGNSAANRSFIALFTISGGQANTDTVQNIAVTGDVTGTWLTADGVIGMTLEVTLACGSTFQGVAGWQSGLILGTSGVSNGMGTVSAVFELFDVGFKMDPDATGVYGQYEIQETNVVYNAYRYDEYGYNYFGSAYPTGGAGAQNGGSIEFKSRKAKVPAMTQLGASTSFNVSANSFLTSDQNGAFVTMTQAGSAGNFSLSLAWRALSRLS